MIFLRKNKKNPKNQNFILKSHLKASSFKEKHQQLEILYLNFGHIELHHMLPMCTSPLYVLPCVLTIYVAPQATIKPPHDP